MAILTSIRKIRLSRSFVIYFLIAQLVILLSNHQIFQEIAATPPGKINLMVHRDWPHDYFSYLAYITQGESGLWLRYNPYTSEDAKPGIFHIYYILVGKITKFIRITPVVAYHLTRVAAVELFVFSLWKVATLIIGKVHGIWGALFGLLATFGPPKVLPQAIQVTWYPYGYPWWENLDSLERLYMPSHHLAGQGLFLLSLFLLYQWMIKPKTWKLVGSTLIIFIAGIIFPPVLLPVAIAMPLAFALFTFRESVTQKKLVLIPGVFFGLALFGASAFTSYEIISLQEQQGYPWNLAKLWELDRWNNEPSFRPALPYLFSILPILIIPATIYAFLAGKWIDIFLVIWAFLPFILFPFSNALGLPRIRLFHDAPYIPFAILTAQTIFIILSRFRIRFLSKIFLLIFFVFSIPVAAYHLYYRILSVNYFLTHGDTKEFYVSQDILDAGEFLKQTVPIKSVVLSDLPSGTMLPAFAPVKSFIGSPIDTIDFDAKRYNSVQFYKQELSETYTLDFLKSNSISYVYFGPNEKAYGRSKLSYSFLEQIYNQGEVIIYKVNL